MRFFKYFIMLLLLTSINYAQQAEDECSVAKILSAEKSIRFSKIGYPGDSNIDVKYYQLDLNINHAAHTLNGSVLIKVKSIKSGLTQVIFDLMQALTVSGITQDGLNASFVHSQNLLTIQSSSALNIGDSTEFIIHYSGSPGSSGFGSFEFAEQNTKPTIWSLSEPYGSSDWWPCKDTPADKADSSKVNITCADFLTPVSNGTLDSISINGDGTHTYFWTNHYPIAQYLISVAISDYTLYQTPLEYSPGSFLPIDHYIYSAEINNTIKAQLEETKNIMSYFNSAFGLYPFIDEKYGHAQFLWGGGMEHQTVSSMVSFGESLIAHELAHQWFGDMTTCKDWHHIWLNEGFATYSDVLYTEHKYGKTAYSNRINQNMIKAKEAVGSIWVSNITSVGEIFNSNRSYKKGSIVLHMLRGIVGDTTFFNSLKSYVNDSRFRFGVATTEDFQSVVESVSGKDLGYFFEEWIYGQGYPGYSISWHYNQTNDLKYKTVIDVTQEMHSNPTFFTMPLQFKVSTSSGDTLITVFNNRAQQSFQFTLENEPTSIIFDPDNLILKNHSIVLSAENNEVVSKFALKQNYPNPFNPQTIIEYSVPTNGSNVELKIFNILGGEITTLVNEFKPAGKYSITFNASNLSSGVYYYQLIADDFINVKKMLLLK